MSQPPQPLGPGTTQPLGTTSARLVAVHLKSANRWIFRALLSLASAALLIRVAGLVNQVVVTARFGAGASMDAYFVASSVPLFVAQLITSASESSVIPVYARVRSGGNKEQASILFSTLLNLSFVGAAVLTLVMFIFRQQVIFLSAPGIHSDVAALAIDLAPFIFPVLVLTVVIGFLECILNTEGQFGWPAYAGILVPLTTVVLVLAAGKSLGVVMLCIGAIVGLCLQLCVVILRARRVGVSYRPVMDLHNPDVGSIMMRAWPIFFGVLITQAGPLVDQIFASFLPAGSISALSYALKLISVPVGVLFVSVGRALLPYLSRQVSINDMKAFKETLRLYLWAVGIVTLALTAFMIVLAHPIVQILFQRGAFTAADTQRTAIILIGFLIGLVPTAFSFILLRAFSALGKTRVNMYITIFTVAANAVFDYLFFHWWQAFGIALATSAVYFCNMFVLFVILQRMIGKLHLFTPPREVLGAIWKIGLGKYYLRWIIWKEENPLSIPYSMRRQIVRLGIIIAIFAVGVVGVIQNPLYTLRAAFASIPILVLLRYRFVLLVAWVLINALNGLPGFRGSNILIGLTIPTLLLMACMPIKQTFKRLPALAFLFIYLLWVLAGIGISPFTVGDFLTDWTLKLDCLAVAILTVNVLYTRQRMLAIIDAILLFSAFIALYGIYGYITKQNGVYDPATPTLFRISSIFADSPTTLSIFLSIVIPLAIYRASILGGFRRGIAAVLVLVLLVALGLTFTRAAYISVPLSIIIMAIFLPSRKMKIGMLSGIAAIVALAVLIVTVTNIPIFNRFFNQDLPTFNGRTYLWQAVLASFDPTQLLGKGLHASDLLLTYLHIGINARGLIDTSPHSLFLGTLYDHGIIGVILLALVFITLLISIIIGMRKATGDHRALFAMALAVLVTVLVQSLDSNNFWTQVFSVYFWIIIALPFAVCWSPPRQPLEIDKEILDDEDTVPRMRAIQRIEQVQISHNSF